MEVCSKTTCLGAAAGNYFYRLQFGGARGAADLQHELFPLHSPLLRESWLVSFPPLSYMFKFSGSSFLTWGLSFVICFVETVVQGVVFEERCLKGTRESSSCSSFLITFEPWLCLRWFSWGKNTQNCSPSLPKEQKREQMGETDTHAEMLPGVPGSATCVQRFDDSLNSAIHITYRISLRSSSLREPRHPLLKVMDVL